MEECSHAACTCRHERDEMVEHRGVLYCSDRCAQQDPTSDGCDCGHPKCEG